MLNKAKHKNQTDSKQNSQVMHTQKQEERKRKVIESLEALFLPHPKRTFPLIKPLNWQ